MSLEHGPRNKPRVPLFEYKPEVWPEIKQEYVPMSQAVILLAMLANGEITQEEYNRSIAELDEKNIK